MISQRRGPPTRLDGRCPWVLLGSFLLDCPCEYLLSCLRLSAPSTPPRSTQRLRHLRPQRLRQLLQLRQGQRLQRHDTCGERPGGNARAVPTCSSHRAANDNGHPSAGRLALLSAASARAVAYYELAELRAAQCATTQPHLGTQCQRLPSSALLVAHLHAMAGSASPTGLCILCCGLL